MTQMTWDKAAEASNKVYKEINKHIDIQNPLEIIYNNALPSFMKDIIYQVSVYELQQKYNDEMEIIIEACKVLDRQGYIDK